MHSLRLGERIRQRPHHFTRSSRMSKRAELSVVRGVRVRSPPKPRRRRSRRSGPVRTSGRHASSASVASAHPYPHARTLPRVVAWRPLCGRHVERAERRVPPLSTRRRSGANRCCWPNRSRGALEPLGTVSEAAAPDPPASRPPAPWTAHSAGLRPAFAARACGQHTPCQRGSVLRVRCGAAMCGQGTRSGGPRVLACHAAGARLAAAPTPHPVPWRGGRAVRSGLRLVSSHVWRRYEAVAGVLGWRGGRWAP